MPPLFIITVNRLFLTETQSALQVVYNTHQRPLVQHCNAATIFHSSLPLLYNNAAMLSLQGSRLHLVFHSHQRFVIAVNVLTALHYAFIDRCSRHFLHSWHQYTRRFRALKSLRTDTICTADDFQYSLNIVRLPLRHRPPLPRQFIIKAYCMFTDPENLLIGARILVISLIQAE